MALCNKGSICLIEATINRIHLAFILVTSDCSGRRRSITPSTSLSHFLLFLCLPIDKLKQRVPLILILFWYDVILQNIIFQSRNYINDRKKTDWLSNVRPWKVSKNRQTEFPPFALIVSVQGDSWYCDRLWVHMFPWWQQSTWYSLLRHLVMPLMKWKFFNAKK